ncbi:MAG: helix-hairpin-helix domain-containing protein [Candidatus Omnitrophica bacterium]|nr:helix-hairpin-helix domain-containing protein [Candidatus Omnitrophota bacterium]
MIYRLYNNKGSILIATLLVIFLLSGLALNLGYYCQRDISATKTRLEQMKSFHLANGVLQVLIDEMVNDKKETDFDTLNEGWIKKYSDGNKSKTLNFKDPRGKTIGTYEVSIIDEAGKLNINKVNTGTLEKLLSHLRVTSPKNTANDIIAMRNNKKPINKIIGYDELLAVKNITPKILRGEDANENNFLDPFENDGKSSPPDDNQNNKLDLGLKDHLTIFSNGLVNINTASATILQTLPGVNQTIAKAIELQRGNKPFETLEDLKTVPAITDTLYLQIAPRTSVRSDWFKIYIKAQINNNPICKEIAVIIDRSTEQPRIVFWREN